MGKSKNCNSKRKLHKGMLLFYCVCVCALGVFPFFGIMIFRIMLNTELKEKLDAISTAGYPTTLAELNDYYPAVPDDENAALLYEKAYNLYHGVNDKIFEKDIHGKKYSKSKDLYDGEDSNKEKSFEDQVLIAGQTVNPVLADRLAENIKLANQQFVDGNRDCINMLKLAIKLPKCRFPIDLNEGTILVLLPHLGKFRDMARLLSVATIIAAENGNQKLVGQNILALLEMGHALDNEPIRISYLVSSAIQTIAVNTLERTLNIIKFDNDALKQISSALESHLDNDNRLLKRCFAGEQSSEINFDVYETSTKIRRAVNPAIFVTLNKLKLLEINEWVFKLKENNLKIIKYHSDDINKKVEELSFIYTIAKMFYLTQTSTIYKKMEIDAKIKGAIIGLAIERYQLKYHKLPEKLDQLVPEFMDKIFNDPFTYKPFRYVTGDIALQVDEEDDYIGKYKHPTIIDHDGEPAYFIKRPGWMVYSFGLNEDDENGISLRPKYYKKGDIPFRCVRKIITEKK